MRRPLLLSTIALGTVATALAGAGTWSTFDDSARSGEFTIDSAEFAETATTDIRMAGAQGGGACPTDDAAYTDNLDSGPISLHYNEFGQADGVSREVGATARLCVRNFGETAVSLVMFTEILVDDDSGCSGLEDTVDPNCHDSELVFPGDPLDNGELDDAYTITLSNFAAPGAGPCVGPTFGSLSGLKDGGGTLPFPGSCPTASGIGPLAVGDTAAFGWTLAYDPGSEDLARAAQTDVVTFKWVVGATVS